MKLKFLGTGTSQGVPIIGCTHPVCLSADPRDRRLRTSALVTTDAGKKILIDCGPDFRQQMLANGESQVDAVLLTHEHNDHIIGLDDMRPIIFKNKQKMPVYAMGRVAGEVRKRFPYAFADEKYPGAPEFELHIIKGKFRLFGEEIIPLKIMHSGLEIVGYKFRNLAYITDGSKIPGEEKQHLRNLDVLIINCLRKTESHHAHFILPEVLKIVQELKPKRTFLIHISHQLGFHAEVSQELPENIQPAYDGLEIEF